MEKIGQFLADGAPFSYVNIGILALVIGIIAERLYYILTNYRVNSHELMAQIRKLVQAGNIDRAIKLTDAAPLPLLQVVKSGLTQVNRGEEAVIASMDEKMAEVVPALEKRIGSLWSFANIATLIGLLGTIKGMIVSFSAVADSNASERAAKLSGGISEAMYNTALGLGIAVLCMIFHLFLHGMAKRHKHELEHATMKLENMLTLKGRAVE
ncbi:MAG: MotA/TolQ/ExbB proton channel family protein [Myxococcales bacterium]|nr:MotA/TolQ/ExbB proton channel family protein [Myxococcales bacterium]MCB9708868.1 MotA/TolQ/ExbB proton channel family protein [Myxococcales bacterium]